ncbi:MAG: hypothetical protein IJE07_07490 [Clostridia bacterium]|nr:hypothetical protein [Clostridia bacterium]
MKKFLTMLLTLLMMLPALAEPLPLTEADFTLRLSPAEDAPVYPIGEDADALLSALAEYTGAPVAMTFEDADCMLPGMTREYVTEDELFIVATRPLPGDPDANTVESVMVFSADVATCRGARVGMTLEGIEALYGTQYALDWDTAVYGDEFGPQVFFFFDTETWECIGWMLFRNMVI